MSSDGWSRVEDAVADLAKGKFVIVCDDESREDEGDLVLAAQ
jgi:3,4-dihydroxy-2-butanone 4-phosphate synthase